MKKGFTLAEVLITLGIIGVVTAMTIPTLITNTNGQKFRSQFKKTLSTLNQAVRMNVANYDFDFAGAVDGCSYNHDEVKKENSDTKRSICAILNTTLTGYTYLGNIGNVKANKGGKSTNYITHQSNNYFSNPIVDSAPEDMNIYVLSDGTIVALNQPDGSCSTNKRVMTEDEFFGDDIGITNLWPCVGFIDVNGTTGPNQEVACTEPKNTNNIFIVGTEHCTVNKVTDIFPILIHDDIVEPLSNAAKYVLNTAK